MKAPNDPTKKKTNIPIAIPVVIILLPLVYSLAGYVLARGSRDSQPFLQMPEERHEYCVRDAEYMRFHHWELLQSVRDEVVRQGKTADVTFDGCRVCHNDRARFCNECHDAANVRPDCFTCHYYPETPEEEVEHE